MRCYSCHRPSREVICDRCLQRDFRPVHRVRRIGSLEVHSFFGYPFLEPLLLTKHHPEGWRIYRWMARKFLAPFFETFGAGLEEDLFVLGIDEVPKRGYAHIAALTHELRHAPHIRPLHAKLLAGEHVSYAGRSLAYRLDHPRDFHYRGPRGIEAVLVDDVITSGITLQEGYETLRREEVDVLFAVTLADAEVI